jgi:hypothetical protein
MPLTIGTPSERIGTDVCRLVWQAPPEQQPVVLRVDHHAEPEREGGECLPATDMIEQPGAIPNQAGHVSQGQTADLERVDEGHGVTRLTQSAERRQAQTSGRLPSDHGAHGPRIDQKTDRYDAIEVRPDVDPVARELEWYCRDLFGGFDANVRTREVLEEYDFVSRPAGRVGLILPRKPTEVFLECGDGIAEAPDLGPGEAEDMEALGAG